MLRCEACTTSFKEKYGDLGDDFIEAHHKNPLGAEKGLRKTKIEDLAMVCSNCHSMLTRDPELSVEALKAIIEQNRNGRIAE